MSRKLAVRAQNAGSNTFHPLGSTVWPIEISISRLTSALLMALVDLDWKRRALGCGSIPLDTDGGTAATTDDGMASGGAVSVPFRLDVLTLKPFFNADDEVAGGSGLFAAAANGSPPKAALNPSPSMAESNQKNNVSTCRCKQKRNGANNGMFTL